MEPTLEVYYEDRLIFASDGRWLYPLFELEEFLEENTYPRNKLILKDKIIGKAAGLLIIRLGIKTVHAGMMSEPGKAILDRFHVENQCEQLVPKILCRTEDLLKPIDDPAAAYEILSKRAQKSSQR